MFPPSSKIGSLIKFPNYNTRAASYHGLHWPMAQTYVLTFAFPNRRSRRGPPLLLGRSISGHTRPQIRFPQYTPQPFFPDLFRTMLEECLLRLDCTMLRLVLFSIYLPHSRRGSDSVPASKKHPGPGVAGRFLAKDRGCHAAQILGRSSTSRPLSHLPDPRSVLQNRLFPVVFEVLSCVVYPPRLPGRYLRLTNASLRGSGI